MPPRCSTISHWRPPCCLVGGPIGGGGRRFARNKLDYVIVLNISYLKGQRDYKLTLGQVKEILDAEVFVGHDRMDMEVKEGGCSDLVTEIPIYGTTGMLLLTGLTNCDVIRAAYDLGAVGVVLVRGKRPLPDAIRLAEELEVPVLSTKFILFETVGRLYIKGLVAPKKTRV